MGLVMFGQENSLESPVLGTHAHSLVQVYGNDYQAFKAYAETHKDCGLPRRYL